MDENNNGFYSKQQDEIIQDENNKPEEQKYNIDYAYKTGTYTYPEGYGKKKNSGFLTVLAVILAALIGAGSAIGVMKYKSGNNKSSNGIGNSNVNINVDEQVSSIAEAVAEKCTPSVVGIRSTTSVMSFFGGSEEQIGSGSGVIYSSDGYIITNYHVIEEVVKSNNGKIEVFIGSSDSEAYDAQVVGYHISSDLAVLKINESGLKAVEFADSSKLSVGQYCVTIGAPGGLEFMGSVTYGIISGLDRVVSTSKGVTLIQTDAAINPGNSGGALLNANGELIGINSSKIVAEEFEGMGFAIPSNTVKEKVERIINKKDTKESYVGITISEKYTASVLNFYGYPAGAVVLSVDKGSPAADAGIERGDIITEFNGIEISEYDILGELIEDCDAGDNVSVSYYRSGRIYKTNLKIGSNSQ